MHHARHRHAFGRRLVEQPLMQNVLADLVLETEAATALSLRVARAVDASARDPREAALARIATALGKYWVCKRAPALVNEAQECLGGAGYVEESMLPRLYRQAPLNSIWEGAGNIQCLDVLRALGREPETRDAFFAELDAARGAERRARPRDGRARPRARRPRDARTARAARRRAHGDGAAGVDPRARGQRCGRRAPSASRDSVPSGARRSAPCRRRRRSPSCIARSGFGP